MIIVRTAPDSSSPAVADSTTVVIPCAVSVPGAITMSELGWPGFTRREALGILGMSAAAAALPEFASAQAAGFPKGAVIRTVLRDYAPEELGGGATLFHEHMSLAPDFLARFTRYSAETRAATGPPPGARGGGAGGAAAGAGGAG